MKFNSQINILINKILIILLLQIFINACGNNKSENNNLPILLLAIASSASPSNTTATPTFSISPGKYLTAQNISISTETSGASVYYTTDGTDPSSDSTLFTTALPIYQVAGVIKAIAIKSGETNSSILSGIFSYPPLQTGQATSYLAGDDQTHVAKGVAKSYTDNVDGTVTDNSTGLIWSKCNVGLSGSTCGSGSTTYVNFANAPTQCTNLALAGKTWRLPNINELRTLINFGASNPSINTTIFPQTISGAYWSITESGANAFTANFSNGESFALSKSGSNAIRCVSGNQKSESDHYVDNNDGTITDNSTGLTWQKCTSSTSGSNCEIGSVTNYTWPNAITYCNNLTLAGKSWRIPNANELSSLAGPKNSGINLTSFPGTPSSAYWTSTSVSSAPTTNAFEIVNSIGSVFKNTSSPARCVTGP
ncbi:MAG: DUF1566 domain-containing protein [Leptospiraceae bacterium]|nr:DUF1566 domain-containing protein [Leptospiraceae bacterium]